MLVEKSGFWKRVGSDYRQPWRGKMTKILIHRDEAVNGGTILCGSQQTVEVN